MRRLSYHDNTSSEHVLFSLRFSNTHSIKRIYSLKIRLKFCDVATGRLVDLSHNFSAIATFEAEINKIWTRQGSYAIWRKQSERKCGGRSYNFVEISGKHQRKVNRSAVHWCLSGLNDSKMEEQRWTTTKTGVGRWKLINVWLRCLERGSRNDCEESGWEVWSERGDYPHYFSRSIEDV